jgi:hypothetical protein
MIRLLFISKNTLAINRSCAYPVLKERKITQMSANES